MQKTEVTVHLSIESAQTKNVLEVLIDFQFIKWSSSLILLALGSRQTFDASYILAMKLSSFLTNRTEIVCLILLPGSEYTLHCRTAAEAPNDEVHDDREADEKSNRQKSVHVQTEVVWPVIWIVTDDFGGNFVRICLGLGPFHSLSKGVIVSHSKGVIVVN